MKSFGARATHDLNARLLSLSFSLSVSLTLTHTHVLMVWVYSSVCVLQHGTFNFLFLFSAAFPVSVNQHKAP